MHTCVSWATQWPQVAGRNPTLKPTKVSETHTMPQQTADTRVALPPMRLPSARRPPHLVSHDVDMLRTSPTTPRQTRDADTRLKPIHQARMQRARFESD
jgi:hypothetical protein